LHVVPDLTGSKKEKEKKAPPGPKDPRPSKNLSKTGHIIELLAKHAQHIEHGSMD
jgi:hypothetical protein